MKKKASITLGLTRPKIPKALIHTIGAAATHSRVGKDPSWYRPELTLNSGSHTKRYGTIRIGQFFLADNHMYCKMSDLEARLEHIDKIDGKYVLKTQELRKFREHEIVHPIYFTKPN